MPLPVKTAKLFGQSLTVSLNPSMSAELSLTPIMFGCSLKRATVSGSILMPGERRHAVKNYWNRQRVGDRAVIIHEGRLRDCRTIEMRRDHQHRISAGSGCLSNFVNCPARALLSCADDEGETVRHCTGSRNFDYLQILALIQDAPARRSSRGPRIRQCRWRSIG